MLQFFKKETQLSLTNRATHCAVCKSPSSPNAYS